MGVTPSARIRQMIAPLSVDAAAVLAGGYSINKLTGDGTSQWWWAVAAGSAVVLVASGAWKLWIERRRTVANGAVRSDPTASEAVESRSTTGAGAQGGASICNGDVSISAKNNSFAAWNVNGTVNLGGSSQTSDIDPSGPATEGRDQ